MASSSDPARSAKRDRSRDTELELEDQKRRRDQEHTISELRAALRSMQKQVAAANKRSDAMQAQVLEAARKAAAAEARAAFSDRRAVDAIEEAERRATDAKRMAPVLLEDYPECPTCLFDMYDENAPVCKHPLHRRIRKEMLGRPAVCLGPNYWFCPVCWTRTNSGESKTDSSENASDEENEDTEEAEKPARAAGEVVEPMAADDKKFIFEDISPPPILSGSSSDDE